MRRHYLYIVVCIGTAKYMMNILSVYMQMTISVYVSMCLCVYVYMCICVYVYMQMTICVYVSAAWNETSVTLNKYMAICVYAYTSYLYILHLHYYIYIYIQAICRMERDVSIIIICPICVLICPMCPHMSHMCLPHGTRRQYHYYIKQIYGNMQDENMCICIYIASIYMGNICVCVYTLHLYTLMGIYVICVYMYIDYIYIHW